MSQQDNEMVAWIFLIIGIWISFAQAFSSNWVGVAAVFAAIWRERNQK